MKNFRFCYLLLGILHFLLVTSVSANPTTSAQVNAGGVNDSQSSSVNYGQIPDSSQVSVTGPSSTAMARALNNGVLGTASTSTGNVLATAWASIQDKLTISLPQIVPTADGIAILMHIEGQMSLDNTNNTNAEADLEIRVTVDSTTAVGRLMLFGYPYGRTHPLQAPVVDMNNDPIENLFLHPRNRPFYPIGNSSQNFSIFAPLYVILKGIDPSTFISGKEFNISILTSVYGGPGESRFYDSLTFDTQRPVFLYSNDLNDIVYLPEGSTYNSATGMGIPATPTEPLPNPPAPNPMTWEVEPHATSTTSISMTASTAMAQDCPPASYYFELTGSPTGGTGGADSGWQESTQYVNTGLEPNHQYGYVVTAASCFPIYQETDPSIEVLVYTLAMVPAAAPFSNLTPTAIRANWYANGNPAGTEYWCENMDTLDNSGWTMNTYWDNIGLNPGTAYHFRVRARNGDTIAIDTEWVDLGLQETPLTLKLYLPLILR
jgi:hypothetical protein